MKCPSAVHRTPPLPEPVPPALGYSLTELILSILIISILAAIMFQFSSNKLRARAERTGCESHLKTLYSGFSTYLTDNGEWPQMPDHEFESDSGPGEENYWEWWITPSKSIILWKRNGCARPTSVNATWSKSNPIATSSKVPTFQPISRAALMPRMRLAPAVAHRTR